MRWCVVALLVAGFGSPALAGTCSVPLNLTGSAAVASALQNCRPGDVVLFRTGAPVCSGARCEDDGSAAALCDMARPASAAGYGLVTCFMRAPAPVSRPAARVTSPARRL